MYLFRKGKRTDEEGGKKKVKKVKKSKFTSNIECLGYFHHN